MKTPHTNEPIIDNEGSDEESIDLTNLLNALRDSDWLLEIQPYKQTELNNQLPFPYEKENLELKTVIVKTFTKPIKQNPFEVLALPFLIGGFCKDSSLATLSDETIEAMTDMFIKAFSDLGLNLGALYFDFKDNLYSNLYPLRYLEPTTETFISSTLTYEQFLLAVYEWYNQVPIEETMLDKNIRGTFYHFMKTTRNMVSYFINKEYSDYLGELPHKDRLHYFNVHIERLYEDMPINEFVDLFKSVYISAEYGFDELEWSIIVKALKQINQESSVHFSRLPKEFVCDGYITIYRGLGRKSTDIEIAKSWTLDKEVARKFATRFMDEGEVYQAQVKVENILAYFGEKESEVLVDYEYLIDVKQID